MKLNAILAAVVFAALLLMTSCDFAHAQCPGYGKWNDLGRFDLAIHLGEQFLGAPVAASDPIPGDVQYQPYVGIGASWALTTKLALTASTDYLITNQQVPIRVAVSYVALRGGKPTR